MSFLFLPRLKEDDSGEDGANVRTGTPGQWDVREPLTYNKIAESLDIEEPGRHIQTMTSIPNVWARSLLVETALHTFNYPLREKIVEQWQGMLAAIALADVRQFDLKVQPIKLTDFYKLESNTDNSENTFIRTNKNSDPFARALYELLPETSYILYELEDKETNEQEEDKTKQKNPWQNLYIFLWGHKAQEGEAGEQIDVEYNVVGISSPSTLVCPAEEGKWAGLEWWDERTGRLSSPNRHLNREEKALLWLWLENHLITGLGNYRGVQAARNNITKLLEEFKASLDIPRPNRPFELIEEESALFGTDIQVGALKLLNRPIQAEPQPSTVKVIPSSEKKEEAPILLLIDPEICERKGWKDKRKQDIWIYEKTTLKTRNFLTKLRAGDYSWQEEITDESGKEITDESGKTKTKKVEWIEAKDLLLEELFFIKQENALINGLKIEGSDKLRYKKG